MNNEENTNSVNNIPGVKIAPVEGSNNSNLSFQPSVENNTPSVEPVQSVSTSVPEQVTEVQSVQPVTAESTNTVQPAIAPSVSVSSEVKEEIVEGTSNITSATEPDLEREQSKEFVVRSKKDEVAAELEKREKIIEEHVKNANANYKPNSKLTNFFLIFFLIGIVVFVIFLPNINEYFLLKEQEKNKVDTVVRSGVLVCEYEKSSDNLDYKYTYRYNFSKEKISGYSKSTEVRGSLDDDNEKLDELDSNCDIMASESKDINGLEVSCARNNLIFEEELIFDLAAFDVDKITSAYTEAGGEKPTDVNKADVNLVEKKFNQSGASCKRIEG